MPAAHFDHVAPVFPVQDVEVAIAWYQAKLGFRAIYVNRDAEDGDPTNYAVLASGQVLLHLLRQGEAGAGFGGRVEAQFTLSAGVDELFAALHADGARILQPLLDQPWGCRDFQIADPDGNKIWISQRLDTPEGARTQASSR